MKGTGVNKPEIRELHTSRPRTDELFSLTEILL